MSKNSIFYVWLFIWATISLVVLFTTNGIGDHADGLMHFLNARYAHLHPSIFLDPWAKTGYTLLAWPFAQFGLKGIMFLNLVCVGINLCLVNQLAKQLGLKYPWVAAIILSLSTFYFTLMFSGLTEHVFSFVLTLSIYFLAKNKWILGTIILSSLPFFRQEGYIIIISLLPFYLYNKKIRSIPLLISSFLLVGIVGGIYYSDILWIIRSNPYKFSQSYGSGHWYSFIVKLYYTSGLLNLLFFIMGVIGIIFVGSRSFYSTKTNLVLLLLLPFLAFVFSHALFWQLGIFHSMGLSRVLNCVTPLLAIISAYGFSYLLGFIQPKGLQKVAVGLVTIALILFPFLPTPSGMHFNKDLSLTNGERNMKEACQYIQSAFPKCYIYAEHPMVPYFLQIDPFDAKKFERISLLNLNKLPSNSVIVWENALADSQGGLTETVALQSAHLQKIKEYTTIDLRDHIIIFRSLP